MADSRQSAGNRRAFRSTAAWNAGSIFARGSGLLDISLGGALLAAELPLPAGAAAKLRSGLGRRVVSVRSAGQAHASGCQRACTLNGLGAMFSDDGRAEPPQPRGFSAEGEPVDRSQPGDCGLSIRADWIGEGRSERGGYIRKAHMRHEGS